MRATFIRSEVQTNEVVTYYFMPDHKLRYDAGQFVELTVKHSADERGTKRWFTLSSSPSETELAITTRIAANGSTFKQALKTLIAGDTVYISQAMGDFILPKSDSQQLIFVAAGIGVTPFRSILKYLSDMGQKRLVYMLATTQKNDSLPFHNFLQDEVGDRLIIKDTRTSANEIIKQYPPQDNSVYYVAGPERFIETIVKDLLESGIANHQVVADYFHNYTT